MYKVTITPHWKIAQQADPSLDMAMLRQLLLAIQQGGSIAKAAVGAYIASGMADVGFGVETAAQRFGLDFIELARERYFFALPLAAQGDPLIRQAIGILQSHTFGATVDALAGYDAAETGKIMSLAEAFGAAPAKAR